MSLKNRTFTDEQFIEAIKSSFSIAETLRKLSLIAAGANYRTFGALSKKLNVDFSHFTGQRHLKGKTHTWSKKISLDKILVMDSYFNIGHLKKRLIKENRIEYKCYAEKCGISDWNSKPLSLHLDHINGINTDNRIENLRLLCPNCHSQTPTYCGKNKKKKPPKVCLDCDKEIYRTSIRCKPCAGKHTRPTKIQWPELKDLIQMVNDTNYSATGRKLGVSDNAVRQRIKRHS